MKYIIGSSYGHEMVLAPVDDDGPDHALDFIIRSEEDASGVSQDDWLVVRIKASQFYTFLDWLKNWCPDPRLTQKGERRWRVRLAPADEPLTT